MAEEVELEQLRLPWETEDQWQLRRSFLERHWDAVPRKRLVCLSQLFINMEFLGCTYNQKITEEVLSMSRGLCEDRREKRKEIIQKTFLSASDPDKRKYSMRFDTVAADVKRKKKSESGMVVDGSKVGTKSPLGPPPMKRSRESVEPLPDAGLKPLRLVAKDKSLLLVKAQVALAPGAPSSVQLLSLVCNRAKVSWSLKPRKTAAGKDQDWDLLVDDVLITRLRCADLEDARLTGCRVALERLASVCLDVREESGPNGTFLALFTSADKRQGWQSPDESLFRVQEEQLGRIRDTLQTASRAEIEADPQSVLKSATDLVGCELFDDMKQMAGWKRELQIGVMDVLVHSHSLKGSDLGRGKESEKLRSAWAAVVQAILRPFHRVFEDGNGQSRLLSSDSPVTDAALTKQLAASART